MLCPGRISLIFIFAWFASIGFGQGMVGGLTKIADSTLVKIQKENLHHDYDSVMMQYTQDLLNGREYELYYPVFGSDPLLPHERFSTGSVTIEGITHFPVVIQYDTYLDQLVYFDPRHHIGESVIPVVLNKYSIDSFEIGLPGDRMQFRNLSFPASVSADSGFYEIVYDGVTKALIRYKCILAVSEGEYIFKIRPIRYIVNDHKMYRISGRRTLLKALTQHKHGIRQYLRQHKLHVRVASKNDYRRILTYFDSLGNGQQ